MQLGRHFGPASSLPGPEGLKHDEAVPDNGHNEYDGRDVLLLVAEPVGDGASNRGRCIVIDAILRSLRLGGALEEEDGQSREENKRYDVIDGVHASPVPNQPKAPASGYLSRHAEANSGPPGERALRRDLRRMVRGANLEESQAVIRQYETAGGVEGSIRTSDGSRCRHGRPGARRSVRGDLA